ncbi:MAG: hypothetical protein WKF82_07120 [Nocardioidaceae bacterium]
MSGDELSTSLQVAEGVELTVILSWDPAASAQALMRVIELSAPSCRSTDARALSDAYPSTRRSGQAARTPTA